MIELLIGIVGLLVAIVCWLFPPEPLRKLIGVETQSTASGENRGQQEHCRRFAQFVEEFPELPPSKRTKTLAWVDSLDDELLLVAAVLSERPEASKHVTRSWIADNSHPLGSGRSVSKLIEALFSAGVLAPSTEELIPGSYAELDAQRNPSYDYGPMLLATWGILKQARSAGEL